jgi:hypothetical protein
MPYLLPILRADRNSNQYRRYFQAISDLPFVASKPLPALRPDSARLTREDRDALVCQKDCCASSSVMALFLNQKVLHNQCI